MAEYYYSSFIYSAHILIEDAQYTSVSIYR